MYRYTILILIFLSVGCFGSIQSGSNNENYFTQVGVAYRSNFIGVTDYVLFSKYRYTLNREEESSRLIYLETTWKDRPVFSDEIEMDITAAQTRIILKAESRPTGLYKISFYAENKFQHKINKEWQRGPISSELRQSLDEIASDFRHEFKLLY
ncbi:MAG: hypothetical protein P8M59_03150 [Candidatus Marinimicrobia bacterium]|nr:hypothetical protein [Candidatus Neomarinimicrobiota bacterium]